MLSRAAADEIVRRADSGRTSPLLMLCRADTEAPVELFCKLSSGCDEGVLNLAREVIAACLARDLELPVPVPYLVDIPPQLSAGVADGSIAAQLRESSSVGFGSARVDNQFSAWSSGSRISNALVPVAMSALVFDAVIENVDRRATNPNCLVAGDRIRLIDHELGFPSKSVVIDWLPPWQEGSLNWLDQPDGHIFCKGLKRRDVDVSPLWEAWSGVSDDRLQEYRAAIPREWAEALPAVDEALDRIRGARDNIDGVIAEILRVLQ
ncbi:MAG: hypothetical protein OYH76_10175 [Defluviicoccus sp.]|nr:hypothetical protein [Defluviicoccus sp.]MDE0276251.1 hypothetical protein [Defluviicoccus sp.]